MFLSAIGLIGFFFSSSIPEDRDVFKGIKIDCCSIYDKEMCPVSIKDAYRKGCLNKKERDHS